MATSEACAIHPAQKADSSCTRCGAAVCSACVMFQREGYCQACARSDVRGRAVTRIVIAVTFVGLIGVGMFGLMNAPVRGKQPILTNEQQEHEAAYAALEAPLAQTPCDHDAIVALVKAMYAANDARRGLDRSEAYVAACGEHEPLRFLSLAAHKKLGESNLALVDADKLVAIDGANKDYRSWRASLYEQAGELEKAAAEYRIALATSPNVVGPATNIAGVYARLGRPCEAISPLEQLVYHHPEATPGPRGRLNALYANPSCAPFVGAGDAVVHVAPGFEAVIGQARLNGKLRGKLALDAKVSFVTIGAKFAKKAALPFESWPLIEITRGTATKSVRLGVLDALEVEGVRAEHVQAVVTDDEIAGVDGVVGQSFLARFIVQVDAANGTFTMTARTPPLDAGTPR